MALAKQIPDMAEMQLDENGQLIRDGVGHMNDYCRRAVALAHLVAKESHPKSKAAVLTMGPPQSENVLREALLYGVDAGYLLSDLELKGSDTLATAKALSALIRTIYKSKLPDLIVCGRNSLDSDTGQVPPQLAEMLCLPFVSGVKTLNLLGSKLEVGLEQNDQWLTAELSLPAIISCAERLIDPCKIKDPEAWKTADASLIQKFTAKDLGQGPWGQKASPTKVTSIKALPNTREQKILTGSLDSQIQECIEILKVKLSETQKADYMPKNQQEVPADISALVITEPERQSYNSELVCAARTLGKQVSVLGTECSHSPASFILDARLTPHAIAEYGIAWIREHKPDVILTTSTDWGREVASRIAASLECGLVGDAIGLEIRNQKLISHKPAFGGNLIAEIHCSTTPQLATVREGQMPVNLLIHQNPETIYIKADPDSHSPQNKADYSLKIIQKTFKDQSRELAAACFVVGIGQGVLPKDIPKLNKQVKKLGGQLAATRKLTDQELMPRARQIGITGRTIAPDIYIALAASGKLNHMIGVRSAKAIIAINTDSNAPVFGFCDAGFNLDYKEVLPRLLKSLKPLLAG